ncbi:MAG TPA: hypothetical protein VNL71_02550 [Chloroflexota bacterium]|nr:hypothetical protein [Chloroflexota bacterium]
MEELTILLVGASTLPWLGLRAALEQEADLHITGAIADPEQAAALVEAYRPRLVLIAAELLERDAAQATTLVRQLHLTSRVVALGAFPGSGDTVGKLYQAGLAAYLLWRDLDSAALATVLRVAGRTNLLMGSPAVAGLAPVPMGDAPRESPTAHAPATIEREVIQGLGAGLKQHEIAAETNLSLRTVQRTVRVLQRRYHARTLFQLALRVAHLDVVNQERAKHADPLPPSRSRSPRHPA